VEDLVLTSSDLRGALVLENHVLGREFPKVTLHDCKHCTSAASSRQQCPSSDEGFELM